MSGVTTQFAKTNCPQRHRGSRIRGFVGRLPRVVVKRRLGERYTLVNELGKGGMSVVWRARDEVLGRPVAVKVLAGRYAGDPSSRQRIRDEARAAATLSHPNIAQVYDFGESSENGDCHPYVVMELVNGPTLAQRVSHGPLPPRTVFRIGSEVAAALAAAHADGLVHRDIKPANVMITAAGAKVVDFGLAAVAGPVRPDEQLLGTPAYLAPERLTGDAVQPASDVYALGVLLYRLLANQSPWSVDSTTQMLDAHVSIEPDPLPELPGVPPAVTDLVHRCLRKDPADRPTAGEASAILADEAEAAAATDKSVAAAESPAARPAGSAAVIGGAAAAAPDPGGAAAAGAAGPSAGAASPSAGAASPSAGARGAAAEPADAGESAALRARADGSARRRRGLLIGGGVAAVVLAAVLALILVPTSDGGDGDTGAAPLTPLQPTAVVDRPGPSGTGPGDGPPGGTAADDGALPLPGAAGAEVNGGSAGPVAPAPGPGEATATTTARPTAGGRTPTDPSPSSKAPAADGKTLSSAAGSVVARCANGKAHLTSWSAKDPYQVERVDAGPTLAATAVFKHDLSRIRMTVTCVAGVPTAVVLPL
jgi:hypothetical protein